MISPELAVADRAPAVAGSDVSSRSLAGYLLMPRPKDLVKGLLIPVTYGIGLLSAGTVSGESLLRAAVVLLAVELLVYPARYQWNDVRGFVADQRHPSSSSRGRLPGPLSCARSRVLTSCSVAAAKLLAAAALIVLLPGLDLGGILTFAIVGVVAVAIVYELLRSASTGRRSEMPPPVTAGIVSLWITVGAGYVVRGITGLALAVDLTERPTLTVAAAITLWAYGTAFVTSRWALEATAFASLNNGRVTWRAAAGQAREHLLALVRWLPGEVDPPRTLQDWAPLAGRTAMTAPWNLAMVTAGAAAALTGQLLGGPSSSTEAAIAAVAGGVLTTAVITAARWRRSAVALGAMVLLAVMALTDAPKPMLAVLPWLLVLGAYLFFSTRTLRKLARGGPVAHAMSAGVAPIGRLILGRATWEAIHADAGVLRIVEGPRG
ncbi:hypothetical protein NIIDNTM18_33300 [Mycolicibacterium litorale]|uniref:Uncharacterized protein n=1 Tax=Mycolicibacterium litorale TaxID=758802 RepID=A0A6S6P7E3_9MYCO|nr:hypothetical protein [Mycolicibacterium litorale]BCI54052.1 hypothetical protein NIIDNTM18_33300 [Mycolicibacterium litorale]